MKATAGILLFVFLCVFAHIVCWWDQVPGKVTQLYTECASSKTGGGLVGGLIGIGFSKMFWHDGGGTAGYLDYGDRSSAFDRKILL